MSFSIALTNVLITLFYILPGYLLRRFSKASEEHLSTLSAFLIYVGTPCLEFSAFFDVEPNRKLLSEMGLFILLSLAFQGIFIGGLFLILGKKRRNESRFRVMSLTSAVGNVGFFGLPVVRALFPDNPETACYSTCFMVSMNIIIFTVGLFCLTGDKKSMNLRSAFLNPTVLGFFVGLIFLLTPWESSLPEALTDGISLLGSMTTPVCMIVLGIRLASTSFIKVFSHSTVYLSAFCKLLLFPLFCYGIVSLFPLPMAFRASILVLSATPCAAVSLSLAEMYHGETELAADSILVSTLLCFLTIPCLALLVR